MLDNLTRTNLVQKPPMCLLRNALWVDDFLEHMDHVIELPMDVTDDDDWLLNLEEIGFRFYEYQMSLRKVITTVRNFIRKLSRPLLERATFEYGWNNSTY